jgi:hypothetical protein
MSSPLEDVVSQDAEESAAGYRHRLYARSQREWGIPRRLHGSGGWLLERSIPETDRTDAMGCYPLFACRNWSKLDEDLRTLGSSCVAVSIVVDPFAAVDPALLENTFTLVRRWKEHFVVDLPRATMRTLAPTHRRNVATARRRVDVEICGNPCDHVGEWCDLYSHLCQRHAITGIQAFSRASFTMQMRVPGMVMLRAVAGSTLVGMHLWIIDGDVAYGHLGATNPLGYELMAAYTLYWMAMEHFRDKVRWLHLGGAPGRTGEPDGGLCRFKRGWATGTMPAYFCGKVLDGGGYSRLAAATATDGDFFPSYRAGKVSPQLAPDR